jgi:CDP-diacylglycerol--glycerol-3-phosphate 3-phosphatidyltransferase
VTSPGPGEARPKPPLITANRVTFVRLALIPIPCWLLYQGISGQHAALVFATLLGCTDFIDGYLARKHGPTVLGSLMDPIADKVFIATTFLPAVDLQWVPPWMVTLLFAREFFITAARSSYERRDTQLKSSYLSRYKTWVQMCGVAVLMLLGSSSTRFMDWFFAVLALAPVLGYLTLLIATRRRWKGAGWFAVSFAGLLLTHRMFGAQVTAVGLMYFIVGVTWASGLGYLFSVGQLRGRGRVDAGDWVRLIAAVALPCLAVAAQTRGGAASWAIIALISLELAHGGLDNLLAHHRAQASALEWGLRTGCECGLYLFAWLTPSPRLAWIACVAAMIAGFAGLLLAAVQKRRFYLDEPKLRASAEVVAAAG